MNDTTTAILESVTTSWYVGIDVADRPIVKIQFVIGSVDHQTSAAATRLITYFKNSLNVRCIFMLLFSRISCNEVGV